MVLALLNRHRTLVAVRIFEDVGAAIFVNALTRLQILFIVGLEIWRR